MKETDKKLIYLLDMNSAETESKIAEQMHTSKQVINYNIKKLIDNKTIQQCQTMLNINAFGGNIYAQIYGKFLDANKDKVEEIINYLNKHKKVGYFALYGGRFDFTISVFAKNIQEFEKNLEEIFGKYPKQLREYIIAIRIFAKRFQRGYLVSSKEMIEMKEIFNKFPDKREIDDLDRKILTLMVQNSRISMLEISEKLKTPFSTIRTRINNLEKDKVIIGYSLLLDLEKMGLQNYKLFIKTKDKSLETSEKFVTFASRHKNITWLQKTLGNHDFELRVEVENHERLQEIIRDLRTDFSEIIEEIETLIVFKELKEDYGILLNE